MQERTSMKIVISPAKSLDFESELPTPLQTESCFLKEAERLNRLLKKKSARSLSKLMNISDNLGRLNYERNQEWSLPFTAENARPAVYAFSGEVYRGIDVYSLPKERIKTMQNSLRILSGLYGLLKPLDLIQPYRLEMGTRMSVGKNKNLYAFWKEKVTKQLNEELADEEPFVNLASNEYFKAIDTRALKVPVITPVFKELKNGEYKAIMTYAKFARGLMTRYLIEKGIENTEDIKGFNEERYEFNENLSTNNEWVFVR